MISSVLEVLAFAPELLEILNADKDLREAVRTKLAPISKTTSNFNVKINERFRNVTITNNHFKDYAECFELEGEQLIPGYSFVVAKRTKKYLSKAQKMTTAKFSELLNKPKRLSAAFPIRI